MKRGLVGRSESLSPCNCCLDEALLLVNPPRPNCIPPPNQPRETHQPTDQRSQTDSICPFPIQSDRTRLVSGINHRVRCLLLALTCCIGMSFGANTTSVITVQP